MKMKRNFGALLLILAAHGGACTFAKEDPWTANQVILPDTLAGVLKSTSRDKQPLLLHVGFQFLFKNGHIPGSIYVGPANEESGIQHLRAELEKIPRTREIVIYCGCCPMNRCPNVRPAFKTVQGMGFKNVKILSIPDNLEKDWIEKGYPIEK